MSEYQNSSEEAMKKEINTTIDNAKNEYFKCYEKNANYYGDVLRKCNYKYIETLNEASKKYKGIQFFEKTYSENYLMSATDMFKIQIDQFLQREDKLMKCTRESGAMDAQNARDIHYNYCLRQFRNNFRLNQDNIVEFK